MPPARGQDRHRQRCRPGSPGRHRARFLILGTLTLGAPIIGSALAPAQVARADDTSPTVLSATIYGADGSLSTASVTLDQLLVDPGDCPVYSGPDSLDENAPGGRQAEVSITSNNGGSQQGSWPLASVLGCLESNGAPTPVLASNVQAVVVIGANGSAEGSRNSTLSPEDFAVPSDFDETSEVPVISAQNSATTLIQYDRPARSSSDIDFSDEVSGSSPVAVDVYEGQNPLSVTITPPISTTVTAGTQLSFSAQVTGGGSQLSYAWDFDGGAPSSSVVSPAVTFTTAGVYDVDLRVSDQDGDVGEATPVQVTVTTTHTQTQTTTSTVPPGRTTRPSGTGTAATGPVRSSGHTSTTGRHTTTSAQAETHSTSGTSTAPSPSAGTGVGTSTGAGMSADASTTAAATVPPAHSSQASPPTTTATTIVTQPARPRRPTVSTVASAQPGTEVSGLLIGTPRPVPSSALRSSSSRGSATGEPAALRSSSSSSPLAIVAGVLIAMLLLGLGVTRELLGPLIGRFTQEGPHERAPDDEPIA